MDTIKAKARYKFSMNAKQTVIVVDDCPYCRRSHWHSLPVGEGRRQAECLRGEYVLDFTLDNAATAPTGE